MKLRAGMLSYFCLVVMQTQIAAYSQEVTPETKPSTTVTAKIPPPYHDPYTHLSTDPLLKSSISGSLYRNDFFGSRTGSLRAGQPRTRKSPKKETGEKRCGPSRLAVR